MPQGCEVVLKLFLADAESAANRGGFKGAACLDEVQDTLLDFRQLRSRAPWSFGKIF